MVFLATPHFNTMDLIMDITNYTKEAVTQLWKSFHGSFSGFTNGDVFNGSKWNIQPKTLSTTIAVNPDHYEQLIYELCAKYGTPRTKGKHGSIYRCMMADAEHILQQVTITCYSSTSTISVQGTPHHEWVEIVLSEIEHKLSSEDSSFISSHHMPSSTSTPTQHSRIPNFDLELNEPHLTSTPRAPTPCKSPAKSSISIPN